MKQIVVGTNRRMTTFRLVILLSTLKRNPHYSLFVHQTWTSASYPQIDTWGTFSSWWDFLPNQLVFYLYPPPYFFTFLEMKMKITSDTQHFSSLATWFFTPTHITFFSKSAPLLGNEKNNCVTRSFVPSATATTNGAIRHPQDEFCHWLQIWIGMTFFCTSTLLSAAQRSLGNKMQLNFF